MTCRSGETKEFSCHSSTPTSSFRVKERTSSSRPICLKKSSFHPLLPSTPGGTYEHLHAREQLLLALSPVALNVSQSGKSKNWHSSKTALGMCFLSQRTLGISISRLIVPPTYLRTMLPVALIALASSYARWSAQRMMLRSAGSVPTLEPQDPGVTDWGVPSREVTAREQVASKPIPRTSVLEMPDSRRTSLQACEMQFQTGKRGAKSQLPSSSPPAKPARTHCL